MTIETIEFVIHFLGGLVAYITLGVILFGIWQGTRRQAGRAAGLSGSWLRSPWFYLVLTILFFGISWLAWIPLPLNISLCLRGWMLAIGSLLFFPGMGLILWGRLVLGRNYFVSTGFGAQLFSEHQLITDGPFSIIRHPMYTGLLIAALGSLLIYVTWTSMLFVFFAPFLFVRVRREEVVLREEFGERWQEYCRRVPRFFPRLIKRK